jgi:MBG domain (YGX type)/Bacterial lectin/PASTA domain
MRLANPLAPFQKPADKNLNLQLKTSRGRAALGRGVACIGTALMLFAAFSAQRSAAQTCPTSPSYSPDFSSNQSCLTLLGNGFSSTPTIASFQPGGGGTVLLQITPNSTQQRGYAWYTTPQPVGNSFSTTFTFQLTGASNPPADGFAFVIQNSSTGASTVGPTGSDGCGLGFGDDPSSAGSTCVNATGGITNSVAVGFKTSNNGAGLPYPDSVFIASNGTGANCVDTASPNCVIAENDLSGTDTSPNSFGCEGSGICMGDGNVHAVTITYTTQPSASQTNCSGSAGCLDVIMDGTDLFPTGVPFNMTSIGLTNNSAYVGFTGATGGSVENNNILSWVLSTQNFGNVNVCPSGQTAPAPCTATQSVAVDLAAAATVGSIQVVTQGTSPLDFTLASGGTCTGSVAAGLCAVNVTFAPRAPGLRMGAVQLIGSNNSVLATTPIYGVGQGPAVAFSPGTQSTVNTGSYSLAVPNGAAVDAAGDIFIADGGDGFNGKVVEVAANGTATSYDFTLDYPQGMAVDGAGDLFIADNNQNLVIEVPAGCTSNACQIDNAFGLNSQLGVAVDAAGDLFVSSFGEHEVVKVPANGGAQTVVYSPGASSNPIGLAVDAAGDLFVADFGLRQVVEITPSGTQSTVGTGWDLPEAVAVDAAGDVFVADEAPKVVEVPAGCTDNLNNCQITISSIDAYGIAVDAKGDVFLPERNGTQVVEINQSQPPSLSFAATYQNTTTDSPQVVSIENVGNAALDFTAISFPLDFPEAGDENDCSIATPLTPGLVCPLTINFTPTVGGNPPGTPLSESVGLTDNALNVTGATQSISVQGSGLSPEVNVPNVVGQSQTVATGLLSGIGLGLGAVTNQPSTLPIGEVVSQNPAATTPVLVGSTVSIVLSSGVAVPSVVGQAEGNAEGLITGAGLTVGTETTQFSDTVQSGTVISQNPAFPSTVNGATPVSLVVSSGVPPAADQLFFENNYFVTGDYASGGVTLHGSSTGTITVPSASPCAAPNCGPGVPDGADIIDGFLYWTTIETSATPTGNTGTFLGYSITGQQIGSDITGYTDGTYTGTLRVYRADVNNYFQVPSTWNGARQGSGQFTVTLPNSGGTITEGASLVVIYRVLSPLFTLKSVVIYDGSIAPTSLNAGQIPEAMQGFYDAVGGANGTGEVTHLYTSGGTWNNSESSPTLGQSNQYIDTLSPGNAYAAVILSTPVNNSDNDGILDAWKTAQGYTDVKTGTWVPLPGATRGEQDLFVQFDYMCSAITGNNTCDFTQPNLYPSPDAQGNDPLAMVTQAFANYGVHLHLKPGNAISETTCTDSATQFCEFPNQPGVVAWNGSVELSKVWPVNFAACTADPSLASCAPRFPYGQKDSYHYVLFGYSLALPAWTTRAGSITSITTTGGSAGGTGTIVTTGLGTTCPTRITVSGVQGNPNLNAIYDGVTCDSGLTTLNFSTSSTVPAWSYPNNTLAEPVIAVTSGKVTSISGYSDLGGSDSVVSLGQWESSPTQDMSKSATVVAGTLFHELGHTLGLSHGGLYFDDAPHSYIPTFEANCKPNYQSSMNYLFQLDGVGPNAAVTYSNQMLYGEVPGALPTILGGDSGTSNFTTIPFGSVVNLTDQSGDPASFTTSAWYTTTPPSSTASAATMHCDGSPLNNDTAYRVTGPVDSISPAWSLGQNITFDGAPYSDLRGFNDTTALDLRQVGATSGDFASLASETSYGIGGVTFAGSGGVTFAGSGGVTFAGSGGVTFAGSGGVLFAGSGGVLFAGSGGVTFAGSGGVLFAGSGGVSFAGSGGVTFAGSGGVTFAGSGGVTFAGSGGASTNELDYLTANSIVRPPNSPTITPVLTNGVETSVIVDWTAPAFGVVQSYTVYRSASPNGANPIQIGIVNGVGGLPPATEFIDSNPLTSSTVVYTISTTLAPVQIDPTQRSSPPSVPAIVKSHQTIVLGALQSSVTYSSPAPTVTVTATSQSNGNPDGLQVNFVATGPCSVSGQTVASIASGGVSTATVNVNDPGSNPATCTVTASQPGTDPSASSTPPYYDAANSVSESFTIEPQGSTTQPQTITFSSLPNVQYGSTFSVSASSNSGLGVTFGAVGPCQVGTTTGTATVTTTGVGRCTITASAAAGTVNSNTYGPASAPQPFTITPAVLTVTATSFPSVTYEQAVPALTYTINGFVNHDPSSVVSGTPALSTNAIQGSNVGGYTITISTGSLAAANYSFLFVNGTLTIQQASQTIKLTGVPVTAAFNSQFTVGATGGASGNPVLLTSSGSCTNSGATFTMTNSTGPCSVIANQLGNNDYTPAQTIQIVNASGPLLTVSPSSIPFGSVTLGSITTRNITVSNIGTAAAAITGPLLSIVKGGNSNEFVAVNLCPTSLAAGKSCTVTIAFVAGPFYTPQTATLEIMDNAPGSPQPVTLSATVLTPQTITLSGVPAKAAYNSSFTVAATATSGIPVSFTSSGACSNVGAIYTMTSGTGTCSVIANQAGNSTYAAAAQVSKTVSATPISQTITITPSSLPASAAYKSTFTVAASASSGLGVTLTSAGACSVSGSTYTITSGSGTCSVIANQAGNSNYSAAPQVIKTVSATKASQTISFTVAPPATAAYKTNFTVTATASSALAVTYTSSGICSNSGTATYTMTSGTGSCSVIANQAGNSNYAVATQITQTVTATQAAQTIAFTTKAPATAAYKSTFKVAATGGASGNAVTFTSSGACSNSGATYTMTSGTGSCSVIASQAGNSNYAAATPVTETVTASLVAQAISFTTNPPASANLNSSFTVAATGGASGNAIIFTSAGSCSNSGAKYTITSASGTCSVIANQAGNSNYAAAPPVTKTVTAK